MNAVLQHQPLAAEADADARPAGKAWYIVSQVKSNRVVYFTDDPAYQPPMEGDWYFVTHHLGELPGDMTLRNCWGWRFNGGVFRDVREKDPGPELERLLESNRRALLALLREKVNAVRQSWRPSCDMGAEIRRRKLEQASLYLAANKKDGAAAQSFDLLESAAAARNIPMAEAAQLIVAQDQQMWEALTCTELVRERFDLAIRRAGTDRELIELRQQLLAHAWPDASIRLHYPAPVMEPADWSKPLPDVHRAHEIARLGTQLRHIVNTQRALVHKDYVGDEVVLRHKARLAQSVLNHEDGKAGGADLRLLENFAQVHKLSLADGARLVLGAMNEAEQILVNTEMTKDRLTAEIESIENLRDVQRVGAALDSLAKSTRGP